MSPQEFLERKNEAGGRGRTGVSEGVSCVGIAAWWGFRGRHSVSVGCCVLFTSKKDPGVCACCVFFHTYIIGGNAAVVVVPVPVFVRTDRGSAGSRIVHPAHNPPLPFVAPCHLRCDSNNDYLGGKAAPVHHPKSVRLRAQHQPAGGQLTLLNSAQEQGRRFQSLQLSSTHAPSHEEPAAIYCTSTWNSPY